MNVRLSGGKIRFTQSRLERSVVTYARDSNMEEKPVFVQANSNSGQGHVLHYTTSFWVMFSLSTSYFWLAGKTKTKQVVNRMSKWVWRGRQLKRPRIWADVYFIFLSASPPVPARFASVFVSSPLSSAPDKTPMLRRLVIFDSKSP